MTQLVTSSVGRISSGNHLCDQSPKRVSLWTHKDAITAWHYCNRSKPNHVQAVWSQSKLVVLLVWSQTASGMLRASALSYI